jgi:peptidoglycan-associated lipoprotein
MQSHLTPAPRFRNVCATLALSALAFTAACANRPAAQTAAPPAAGPPVAAPAPEATMPGATTPPPVYATPLPAYPPAPAAGMPGATSGSAMSGAGMAASIAALGDRVFFATDSYSLSVEARDLLARQAAWMQANPGSRFLIAGNCDERGTREYNLALGARRASSVRDYLVSLGVAPNRLETVSYGKERPIDDRPNPDGWAINRNAHTGPL